MDRRDGPAALNWLAGAATMVAGASLVAVTLVQAWQVFARYVLNSSPGWTEPVALLCVSLAVMLGAAVAVRRESHFGFFSLRDAAPAPVRRVLLAINRLIALATGVALAAWGAALMIDDWTVPMPGAPLPAGIRFIALVLGGGLIALFAVERLFSADPPPAHAESA